MRNGETAGVGAAAPRTPNLEPIQTTDEELQQQQNVNEDRGGDNNIVAVVDKQIVGKTKAIDAELTRRSRSFELHHNNDSFDSGSGSITNTPTNATMVNANNKPLPRKLPALEVKGNSLKKGKFTLMCEKGTLTIITFLLIQTTPPYDHRNN